MILLSKLTGSNFGTEKKMSGCELSDREKTYKILT